MEFAVYISIATFHQLTTQCWMQTEYMGLTIEGYNNNAS